MNESHDRPLFYIQQTRADGITLGELWRNQEILDRVDGFILGESVYVGVIPSKYREGDFDIRWLGGSLIGPFPEDTTIGSLVILVEPEGSAHPGW